LTSGALYDADGDVTDDGTNKYLYDAEGRICATQSDFTEDKTGYAYDGKGYRFAKGTLTSFSCDFTSNGFAQSNVYVPGLQGEQLQESDSNFNLVHLNVFLGSGPLATYAGSGYQQANWHYSLTDWVGTRRVQANAEGTAEGNFQTMPFGDDLTTTGTPGATEHEFTGNERDQESGNDYFPARYYASSAGRFLSPDWSADPEPVPYASLSNPQSLNLFSYVANNPLSVIDESGHQQGAGEFKPSCTSDLGSGDPYNDCMEENFVLGESDEFDVLNLGLARTGTEWISAIDGSNPVRMSSIDDLNPLSNGGNPVFQTEELGLPVYGNASIMSLVGAGPQLRALSNIAHTAVAGSVAIPVSPGVVVDIPFALIPSTKKVCIGAGGGTGSPGVNVGAVNSSANIQKVLSGASVSVAAQSGFVGGQTIQNNNGTAAGNSMGSPGASVTVTYSWCF